MSSQNHRYSRVSCHFLFICLAQCIGLWNPLNPSHCNRPCHVTVAPFSYLLFGCLFCVHCTVWVIVSILPPHNYTIDNSGNDNEGWTTRYVFYTYIYYIYMDLTIFYRQTSWNDTTLAPPTPTMSDQWVRCLVNNHHAQLDNVNEGWTGDQELERWEQGLEMCLHLELPGMFFINIFLNYSTNVFYSMIDTLTQMPPPPVC